jgi:hypothetical protein
MLLFGGAALFKRGPATRLLRQSRPGIELPYDIPPLRVQGARAEYVGGHDADHMGNREGICARECDQCGVEIESRPAREGEPQSG